METEPPIIEKQMNLTPETISENWPLTDVVLKQMPSKGMVGIVGIIESAEGKYTYKTAGHWKTPERLDRDLSAYVFLNEKGFPYISEVLKTRGEERFIKHEDKLLYLIRYIEGAHPPMTPETYAELGKITAALHSIEGFPFETDYKPADAIPQDIAKAEAKDYPFKDEFVSILKAIPDFTNLTQVPIHTEITPGNTIQTPEGKTMVIDWDEVGTGPAVLDLGVGLINHFVTEDLEILEENARAYYQSYFSLRDMGDEEKNRIYDAGLFWACNWVGYGDLEKRWKRIQWALKNKEKLLSLIHQ